MSTTTRAQRARDEPLSAEKIAPGMFEISNARSGSTHTVDMLAETPACTCRDCQYRMGPRGGLCKHAEWLTQVSDGDLCHWCGYSMCRPSCPYKGGDGE